MSTRETSQKKALIKTILTKYGFLAIHMFPAVNEILEVLQDPGIEIGGKKKRSPKTKPIRTGPNKPPPEKKPEKPDIIEMPEGYQPVKKGNALKRAKLPANQKKSLTKSYSQNNRVSKNASKKR